MLLLSPFGTSFSLVQSRLSASWGCDDGDDDDGGHDDSHDSGHDDAHDDDDGDDHDHYRLDATKPALLLTFFDSK